MNELSALLKRSFEGLGYQQGEYEDAAAAVVWLEARGLNGIEMIASAWPRLESGAKTQIDLTDDSVTLNANGCSAVFCGRAVADLAAAGVGDSNVSCIEVRQCHDRKAIISSLALCAAHDLFAIAHWYDDGKQHIVVAQAQQSGCDYYCVANNQDSDTKPETLTISCACDGEKIMAMAFELAGNEAKYHDGIKLRSTDMQERYETTVAYGMTVKAATVSTLTVAADQVLIEATEQSRLGAGE